MEFVFGKIWCSGVGGPCLAVVRMELGWGSCASHGGRQVLLGRFLGVVQTSAGKAGPWVHALLLSPSVELLPK